MLSRSDQPIGACGQPSALAIGSGIASTIGVETTDSASTGSMSGRSWEERSWRSNCSQVDAAGVQASGAGPQASSQRSWASRDSTMPEAVALTEIP